jgi:elongation factor Ts
VAAEGRIATAVSGDKTAAVLVEVNCETDFVGKNDEFGEFADGVAAITLEKRPADVTALGDVYLGGETVEDTRRALIAKLGEKITVRRFVRVDTDAGIIDVYAHGARIAAAVAVSGGDEELAHDLAMHVAASAPAALAPDDVPEERRNAEKEILMAQAKESGKPEHIVEKMVQGRLNKFLGEITLLGQPFVKDPDLTVAKLASEHGATIEDFARLEVGEGIEKQDEDFAAEVRAQAENTV